MSSRSNYGTRKIKAELRRKGILISRRRISRIMRLEGLVSKYTVAQYKPQRSTCNEEKTANILKRDFNNRPYRSVQPSTLPV
jgi:SOS response regulatory protein OraA/RecX